MAIIHALKTEEPQRRPILLKSYVKLLASDSEAAEDVEQFRSLMIELDKTAYEVGEDYKLLQEVRRLRSVVANARAASPKLKSAKQAAAAHWNETQKILNARKAEQDRLERLVGDFQKTINEAEDGVAAINRFRAEQPELLADEPEAKPGDYLAE